MNNWEIVWLATGIALTTATQLRVGAPIGIGEVMLSAWMLLVGMRSPLVKYRLITPLTRVFFWFWLVSFIALTLGILIAEFRGVTSSGVYHDGFAFIFACVFCLCLTISIRTPEILNKLIANNLVFSTISMTILFCGGVPFLSAWYGGSRFAGWARNPNQIALLISMIPFLLIHLFLSARKPQKKLGYGFLIFCSIVVGLATDSDALMIGWAIGFLTIIALIAYRSFFNYMQNTKTSQRVINIYKALIGIFILLMILFVAYLFYEKLTAVSTSIYNKGDQGSVRLILWKQGITAISSSPLFGLGPGAHSGIKEPFLDFEAHNTFIDWGSSSGIVGLIVYVTLLGWAGWKAWRNGFSVLVAAVISLAVFSSFHFVLRHVVFWFYLLSIVGLSTNAFKDNYVLNTSSEPIKHYFKET